MPQTPRLKKSSSLWKAIAITGIWVGTGISAFYAGMFVIGVAMFATYATIEIAKAK